MRYEMGRIELIGWLILATFVGVCTAIFVDLAIGASCWSALLILNLGALLGAAVPIVVYCRGKGRL